MGLDLGVRGDGRAQALVPGPELTVFQPQPTKDRSDRRIGSIESSKEPAPVGRSKALTAPVRRR